MLTHIEVILYNNSDGGDSIKKKKIPQRLCVGCQTMKPKREMIRIVKTPQNEVIVDLTGKKSGRGVYICPRNECFENALRTKRIEKALECSLTPELVSSLKEVVESKDE